MHPISLWIQRLSVFGIRHIQRPPMVLSSWLRWMWAGFLAHAYLVPVLLGASIVLAFGVWLSTALEDILEMISLGGVALWGALGCVGVYALFVGAHILRQARFHHAARARARRHELLLSEVAYQLVSRLDPERSGSIQLTKPAQGEWGNTFAPLSNLEVNEIPTGWTLRIQGTGGAMHEVLFQISTQKTYARISYAHGETQPVQPTYGPDTVVRSDPKQSSVSWTDDEHLMVDCISAGTQDAMDRARAKGDSWVEHICTRFEDIDPLILGKTSDKSPSAFRGTLHPTETPPQRGKVHRSEQPNPARYEREIRALHTRAKSAWAGRVASSIFTALPCAWLVMELGLSNATRTLTALVFFATSMIWLCGFLMYFTHHIAERFGGAVMWNRTPLQQRVAPRTLLSLDNSILTAEDVTIDLARPFHAIWTRAETKAGDALLGVELVQTNAENSSERLTFEVPVERSLWWEKLARLERHTTLVDGTSFDAWLLPALSFYLPLHGSSSYARQSAATASLGGT